MSGGPKTITWEYSIEGAGRSGALNMATDAWLLQTATPGVGRLRLYRWDPPCLSFGRNEPALRRYGRDAVAQLGIATVRRPTGGRAVWHDQELTYAMVGPLDLFGSLQRTYISIHEVLAAALSACGAEVALAGNRPTESLGSGPCFAAPVGGEVVCDGGKVVGSAQVRVGSAFLQHGSVLLGNRQELVSELVGNQTTRAVALNDIVGRTVEFAQLADAIVATAQHAWGGSWSETEFVATTELREHFGDDDWTWRR